MTELFEHQVAWTDAAASAYALSLRGSLVALFVVSAWSKFRRSDEFQQTLNRYGLVPKAAVPALGWAIPVLELALATALATLLWLPEPLLAAGGILAIFAFAIAINLTRGKSFDCGCSFLRGNEPISWSRVGRNLILAAACASAGVVMPSAQLARNMMPAIVITTAAFLVTGLGIGDQWLRRVTPYRVGSALRHFHEMPIHVGSSEPESG
jgi:hypothetical protein